MNSYYNTNQWQFGRTPTIFDLYQQPAVQDRMRAASNAGIGNVSTGYLTGIVPAPTNWNDWAQTMQNSYGVPNQGSLGGTSYIPPPIHPNQVPPAGAGGSTINPPGTPNTQTSPGFYTGYGNSSIGYQKDATVTGTPTGSTNTGGSITGNPQYNNYSTPTPWGGALSGLNQLLNQTPSTSTFKPTAGQPYGPGQDPFLAGY